MRTKQPLILASLALLLLAAATGCADHDNDPATTAANGLPVDFSSIRIAASANGTGGSTSNVPTTDEGGFYPGDVIHARLTHDGKTQEARLTNFSTFGSPDWQTDKTIYWQSTDPNTGQTLTLSRGEEGDFTLPDDMDETTKVELPDGSGIFSIWNYTLHDRLFHSYRGPMPAAPITWELDHCMAQIVVTLTRADGSTLPTNGDLNYARVSMTLPAEGRFDGVSGNVSRRNTGAGGAAGTKPVKFYKSAAQAGVYNHFAVALPGSTDTRIITITIPAEFSSTKAEQTYQYTAPANIDLEAGRSHVFRLSLGTRVSALSITTTDWKAAEQGTGVSEGIGIKGVTPGKLKDLLPSATANNYGHISVSGELNANDYGALNAFLNSLPSSVSLEIDITGGSGIIPRYVFSGCNKLGAVELKGITEILDEAFVNSSLTSITLPEGLTHIYQSAFGGCKGLKSISLPSSVTYLGQHAFTNCINLASVSLPEGLQVIDHSAFSDCTSLKSITLPPSVSIWGPGIFAFSGLTSIALPEGMTEIPYSTFQECADLKTITLPSTITVVGDSAFYLSGLTSIILPEGVKTIGEEAFKNCTKLLKVAVANTKDISVGTDAFAGTPGEKELFVYVEANSATFLPGTKWKGGHIKYKGSGDLLEPDSYNTYYNY